MRPVEEDGQDVVTQRRATALSTRIRVSCRQCALAELCFPRGLEIDEVDELDRIIRRRRPVPRGECVYQTGEPAHSLYAVHSGCLKTYASAPEGREHIVGFYLPGEVIGLDGLDDGKHQCTAITLEMAHVCELPLVDLERLYQRLPGLPRRLLQIIGREIASAHTMLLLLGKRSAEARLAAFLLNLSARLARRGFSSREFNLTMPRDDIAVYLGLARETVSRVLTRFQLDGLLRVQRKHICIRDRHGLEALASAGTECCA